MPARPVGTGGESARFCWRRTGGCGCLRGQHVNPSLSFSGSPTGLHSHGTRLFRAGLCAAVLWFGGIRLSAAPKDGFQPLFNGNNLSGWVNVNCAPETWSVKDGMIHCTGLPTGALRTIKQYENFILELDWRHLTKGGNSGVFIWASPVAAPGVPFLRAIEVQVLDHGYDAKGKGEWYTTHGDVFPIHGATMKPFGRHNGMRSFPSSEHSNGSPEWNHYRVVCTNGVLRLSVNGIEVSGGEECNYRKGYIGLESEGAPIDFRNIRLQELPSSQAALEVTAPLDTGWRPLFSGLDLRGWRTNATTAAHWAVAGERLLSRADAGTGPAPAESILWTSRPYRDSEWMFDCRPTGPGAVPLVWIRGAQGVGTAVKLPAIEAGASQRYTIRLVGRAVTLSRGSVVTEQWTLPEGSPKGGEFGLGSAGGTVEFMNLYVRDER